LKAYRAEAMQGTPLFASLSFEDIEDAVPSSAFRKGSRYQRQGRVVALSVAEGGKRIAGRVIGSEPTPYSQTIHIREAHNGAISIAGECSCPVGFNCKHVAAVLIELVQSGDGNSASRTAMAQHDTPLPLPEPPPRIATPPAPAPPSLAPELAAWLDTLARLQQSESEEYPPDIRQRLIYVLALSERKTGLADLVVQPTAVRLLKGDTFSEITRAYPPSSIRNQAPAKFLRPSDREILEQLHRLASPMALPGGVTLSGEQGAAALEAMIATGRARWGAVSGPVVSKGAPRAGRIAWRLADDGTQHPYLLLDGPSALNAVPLAPPWYVDESAAVMGPVETDYAPRLAAAILSAPAVPARQTALLRAALARRLPALGVIEPPDLGPPECVAAPLVPGLRLMVRDLPQRTIWLGWEQRGNGNRTERTLLARPSFRYGAIELRPDEPRAHPTFARDGKLFEIRRDPSGERKAFATLAQLGFEKLTVSRPYDTPDEHRNDLVLPDAAGWIDLLYHDVPALRAAGWEVEIEPDFPVRVVRADTALSAVIREQSGIDWFELDLGVVIDGERLDIVPAILSLIADPQFELAPTGAAADEALPVYVPLADGRILAMPSARLRPLLAALRELLDAGAIDPKAKRLGFSVLDAAALAEIEGASAGSGAVWEGGAQVRQLGRRLREAGGIPSVTLPATFTATLRPYQSRGVDWLQFLREAGLGGVLADDMGLGKTVQTLAHIAIEKASGRMDRPVLVVAPTSLVANWRQEASRFVPDIKVLALHGAGRKACFGKIAEHDLVLTTYPLLARDHAILHAQPWHMVVLDEAQTIKNPDAATTRLVNALDARHRVCLTGTPLENHLGELWSLFAFLSPGFLGDRQSFHRRWRIPIEKKGDHQRRRLLARRVRPFLLRRAKSEVAADLPAKTEIVEPIEMDGRQREIYESIRLAMHDKVRQAIAAKGLARCRIVVLEALLKLRQACCDPRLLKLKASENLRARSAKLDRLMEMIPELLDEGRRILLFSQFTTMLALIEEALAEAAIPYVLLTGDTRDRQTPIKRFQTGEVPLFLISLKAGGLGLNLTAADTVIHYDPWWNPAVEDQATDRAHRIGQDKAIFVHKLVTLQSIEEKMEALKARKRDLAAGLFDSEAGSAVDLTEADVETLLGPA
jgi:superfamily II DNA or RNA helicase